MNMVVSDLMHAFCFLQCNSKMIQILSF